MTGVSHHHLTLVYFVFKKWWIYTQKRAWLYTNSYVEHVYNTRTTLAFGERGKGKGNDRASVILYNITSVKVEDIRMCIESCWKMGGIGKGVRESNRRGWMGQSKVYWQQGYIEKSLWTST
jgi:hypothetical protein